MSMADAMAGPAATNPAARSRLVLGLLALALPVAILVAASIGSVAIPSQSWRSILAGAPDGLGMLVVSIRLPRVVMAGLVGAGLALAGAAMQALFRNPLADPGLTGPAAGAMLATVAVIVFWHEIEAGPLGVVGTAVLPTAAMIGCALTTALVYVLARSEDGHVSVARLLLAGIGVNAFAAAVIGIFIYVADDSELRSIQFWMMGSLSGMGWVNALVSAPVILIGGFVLVAWARSLDLFTLGESEAYVAGVDTLRLKRQVVIAAACATGASVAFTGLIGFVGLVAPHCARFLGGPRHPVLLPASALFGAILVIFADSVARIVVTPAELPIGLVTSLVGAPFFMLLLRRRGVA